MGVWTEKREILCMQQKRLNKETAPGVCFIYLADARLLAGYLLF